MGKNSQRKHRSVIAIAVCAGLTLAACGGDDDADEDVPEATEPAGATAPEATPGTEAGEPSTQETAPPTGDGDAPATTDGGAGTPAPPASDVEPVKVGVVLSSSGPVAQIGQQGEKALKAFQECWTFENGGTIEFEIFNDGSDPTQAVAAIDTLVDAGVVAFIGFSGSSFGSALPRLLETELPVIFIPPIPYPNFNKEPYIFSPNIPQVQQQIQDFIAYADALGAQKPVVLTTDDVVGDSVAATAESFELEFRQVPTDVTNYEPILSELRDQGYDALITSASSGAPPAFIAQARTSLGWDVPQFLSPSNLTADYVELAGDAAEGSRGFVWPIGLGSDYFTDDPEQAAAVAMIEECMPGENYALNPPLGFYWDNALSIALGIDAAGSADPDAIRDALETLEFKGAFGHNQRTAEDHVGYQQDNAVFGILEGGQVVPAEDATRG